MKQLPISSVRSARSSCGCAAPVRSALSQNPVPVHPMLQLQQTIGNRAVQRLICTPEQGCAARENEAAGEPLAASVDAGLASPAGPLDEATRAFFEPRFGYDLGQVAVHTGSDAARSAGAVNAKAYTVGPEIVFGEGQYAPQSAEGKKLIAHELAHVVQQGEGSAPAPAGPGALAISEPSDSSEMAADRAAADVLESGARRDPSSNAGLAAGAGTVVHRSPLDFLRKIVEPIDLSPWTNPTPPVAAPSGPGFRPPGGLGPDDRCWVPGKEPLSQMRLPSIDTSKGWTPNTAPSMEPSTMTREQIEEQQRREEIRKRINEHSWDYRDDPGEPVELEPPEIVD